MVYFQKMEVQGTLLKRFYEVSITLTPKSDQHMNITKKEHYRPLSFMNIDEKILKKNTSKLNLETHTQKGLYTITSCFNI